MSKPIGEILIEQGSVTKEQLERALAQQKVERGKRRLGEVLIEMGVITEIDMVIALSTQFNFPYLPLKNISPNLDAVKEFPQETLRKCSAFPIDKQGTLLTLVMADPSDENVLDELRGYSKCEVQVFIATLSEIESAIEHFCTNANQKQP